MTWVCWNKVLASKKNGGLGVSSLFALLFKWVWRFITQGSSLWARFIKAIHDVRGTLSSSSASSKRSLWLDIIREMDSLKNKEIDLMMHFYALETCKQITIAEKMRQASIEESYYQIPRDGVEREQ
ncbi:hypothetical protein Tco_1233613 [Tanacetum coccineum]